MVRFLVDLSVNCYSVGLCPDTRHNQVHSIMHGRDESHKTVSVRISWRYFEKNRILRDTLLTPPSSVLERAVALW